jgi:hypothetical protein
MKVEIDVEEDRLTTKQREIRRVISKTIKKSRYGVTLPELVDILDYDKRTIAKHLFALLLTGEIYYLQRGKTKVYYSNLASVKEGSSKILKLDGDELEVLLVENAQGEFVYLRHTSDELPKGGILIPKERFSECVNFLKEWCNKLLDAKEEVDEM